MNGIVVEGNVRGVQPMILQQLRDQMFLGDLKFLVLRVASQPDDFHAVAQGAGDVVQHVRRCDEQGVRQIVRNLQIAIDECVVLLRIEDFQQRGRGVAAEVLPDLVNLVDHDQRVVHGDLKVTLDQLPRHGADIRFAVASNLRLVGHAADGHPHELPPQGIGDGGAKRRLAHARRSGEAENRTFEMTFQLEHRQELQHALLHLFQAVMAGIENLFSLFEIELILRVLGPGHLKDGVEVRLDYGVVGR